MAVKRISRICPYCGGETKIVNINDIKSLRYVKPEHDHTNDKQVLVCCNYPDCDSYTVFPRRAIEQPGVVADKHLRLLRSRTHDFIDIIGKSGMLSRSNVYKLLSENLNKAEVYSHVRYYDVDDCIKAILFACKYIFENYVNIKSYENLSEKQLHIVHCILDSEFTIHYNNKYTAKDLKNALSCIYDNEDISIFAVSLQYKTCTLKNKNTRSTSVLRIIGNSFTEIIKNFNETLYNKYIEINA